MGADRHNGILMSLLLLVAETIKKGSCTNCASNIKQITNTQHGFLTISRGNRS